MFESEAWSGRELALIRAQWPYQPTISIVLPVYNIGESFLRAALDSVLGQNYPNWQLCIADDCSADPERARDAAASTNARDSRMQVAIPTDTTAHLGGIDCAHHCHR